MFRAVFGDRSGGLSRGKLKGKRAAGRARGPAPTEQGKRAGTGARPHTPTPRESPRHSTRVRGRDGLFVLSLTVALAFGFASTQANGQDADTSAGARQPADSAASLFGQHIRPLLETRCLSCHNSELKQSGLDLSTRAGLLRGGSRGPAIVADHAEQSLLVQLVRHNQKPNMPFMAGKLSDDVLAHVVEWVNAGAPYDAAVVSAGKEDAEKQSTDHWAFQPPTRPDVPEVNSARWVRNTIDAFIVIEHEKRGLTPAPPAKRRVLLRRVYVDLIGLPPTPEQMTAFLADTSDDAYETVVDELLDSPRYGERWGRHWMDIWRYSDWYGFRQTDELRNGQHHIWHWRDWIIDAVNEDKGYDRMIVEMLAGDEIAPNDPNVLRATGYLARNWYKFNRNVWLQDTVEHTAAGFLGITLKCARCHDHKYDPIQQHEYYRFRAFFEPHDVRTDRVPGEPDLSKAGIPRAYDADLSAKTLLFLGGDEAKPVEERPLEPGVPRAVGGSKLNIQPISLGLEARYPDFRPFVHEDLVTQAKQEIEKAEKDVAEAVEEIAAARRRLAQGGAEGLPQPAISSSKPAEPGEEASEEEVDPETRLRNAEAAHAVAEKVLATARSKLPALEARIAADKAKHSVPPESEWEALALEAKKVERLANLRRADESVLRVQQLLKETEGSEDPLDKDIEKKLTKAREQLKAAQEALESHPEYTPVGEMYPETSTGRRLALAKWIAGKSNPLTTRVAVNHMWRRHFGSALVPTVANFGSSGKPPTHPELLDWLAVEFMDQDWGMKAMHRLMVTSTTYRMQSSERHAADSNRSKDPDNIYLWRMNPRRMEAEAVRDSVLHVSRRLDLTMGGTEVDHTEGAVVARRSVYFQHTPDLKMQFLSTFDLANPLECYERLETVVPQQALALANSKLGLTQARLLARDLTEQLGGRERPAGFVKAAFEHVLGRPATKKELARSKSFLQSQSGRLQDLGKLTAFEGGETSDVPPATEPWLRARENLIHVLFNHNEFVTIR